MLLVLTTALAAGVVLLRYHESIVIYVAVCRVTSTWDYAATVAVIGHLQLTAAELNLTISGSAALFKHEVIILLKDTEALALHSICTSRTEDSFLDLCLYSLLAFETVRQDNRLVVFMYRSFKILLFVFERCHLWIVHVLFEDIVQDFDFVCWYYLTVWVNVLRWPIYYLLMLGCNAIPSGACLWFAF